MPKSKKTLKNKIRTKQIKKQINILRNNVPRAKTGYPAKAIYAPSPVALPDILSPDYGEYIRINGLSRKQTVYIENPSITIGNYGIIGFVFDKFLGTIETTKDIAKKYINKPFSGVIQLNENGRYLTDVTKEWVTPFEIIELL